MSNLSTQQLLKKIQQLEDENQQLKSREIEVSGFTETIMEDAQKDIHKLIDENTSLKRKLDSDSDKLRIIEEAACYYRKMESAVRWPGYSSIHLIKELINNEYSIETLTYIINKIGYYIEDEDNFSLDDAFSSYDIDEDDLLDEMTQYSNHLPEDFDNFSVNEIIDYIWKNKKTYRIVWIRICDDIIDWVKINNKVYYITI